MKKLASILAIFLAGSVFMTSCGTIIVSDDNEAKEEEEKEEKGNDKHGEVENEDDKTAAEETEKSETDRVETVQEDTVPEKPASTEYIVGTHAADGTYSSEWLGLRFTPNDDLVMSTEEELYALMNYSASEIVNVDLNEELITYEMMAVDPLTGATVTIVSEKLMLSAMTEQQYLTITKAQYEKSGFSMQDSKEYEMELAGETYSVLECTLNYLAASVNNVQLLRKIGNRMVIITVSHVNGDNVDFFDCFSEY